MSVSMDEEEDSDLLSLRSDWSKERSPFFNGDPKPSDIRRSSNSAGSDLLSLRSDWSKERPPFFNGDPKPSDTRLTDVQEMSMDEEEEGAESEGSDLLSLRSDWSKERPPFFNGDPKPSGSRLPEVQEMSVSMDEEEDSDLLSLRSDWSKERPPFFNGDPKISDIRKRKRSITAEEQQQPSPTWRQDARKDQVYSSFGLEKVLDEHKRSVRRRCERVTEGSDESGGGILLNRIYTELHITEGQSGEVQWEHEVMQLETASRTEKHHDTAIRCQDIFKTSAAQQRPIRVVLTNGVAGVGKTFSVHKFTLDWAEGLENQDVGALVVLSFRELNLVRHQQYSLLRLLQVFHPALQEVTAEKLAVCRLLFILDGLDESRLSLDFHSGPNVSDVTQESSIDLLLTNLIQGNLLPSARVWITSRPAAANQIPPSCVDRLTEVRGFTDAQKEEYFRRRLSDEELCSRIISHIQTSRSLHIMCRIPVFCWITATVLEHMLSTEQRGELPKTMTDMYSHFIMVQKIRKRQKYHEGPETCPEELSEADREVLLNLGRMAFEHLERGNIVFYQDDLKQCGLDVSEASVYSGVFTEIFRRECVIFQKPVYSFIHLSIQEFLAAVYVFHCYSNKKTDVLEKFLENDWETRFFPCLSDFMEKVTKKCHRSQTGHLDLFVRFLHGLTLESNRKILGDVLGQIQICTFTIPAIIKNLKSMKMFENSYFRSALMGPDLKKMNMTPDRSINIFHCLMEMKDLSVQQEIQEFLKSENRSEKELSGIHCSALAHMLQMSEEVLEEFDLKTYNASTEGLLRLIPAVRNCRKARLSACGLTGAHCEIVASALKSNPSHLTELAFRIHDSPAAAAGVPFLCAGLTSPHCKLETLRFERSTVPSDALASLFSALQSNPSRLKHLDLRYNMLGEAGMKQLCEFLESPHCKLETLGLKRCNIYWLRQLCGFLESPQCRLESLRLSNSWLTGDGCCSLASTLKSIPSSLKYLKLSGNHEILDSGVQHLCGYLESPLCRLETLRLRYCGMSPASCGFLVSALKLNPSHLKHLDVTKNKLQESDVQQLLELVENPAYSLQTVSWEKPDTV
ncbi:protein NLRC3-like isoform X2 [Salarias fasciatus]|uniref:NACHT, LRR and PYD domains-containing protein 12-like n=1 Tax=Salarias fasciatus TaxID=181472 RepID=A0A672GJW2_SALFA|nr:protein NLRC3-like isoform X2 [Salarias fasciatus]